MLIELHGADFQNKGGQLMLETAIHRVKSRFPEAEFCLESDPRHPRSDLRRLNLRAIYFSAPRRRPRRQAIMLPLSHWVGKVTPSYIIQRVGEVRRHSVDALLDVSGYAFGDPWGTGLARAFVQRTRYYGRRGRPVVLLPQMFGPFCSPTLQNEMRCICRTASFVYARDSASYECLQGIVPADSNQVRLAPDITIFTPAIERPPICDEPYVCIVPNVRILDKGPVEWRDHYLQDLANAIRLCRANGMRVFVVVHETMGGDDRLAQQLAQDAGLRNEDLFHSDAPLELKAILAGAYFVLASRFHAAIGALSSGVPTIVLGWAHKYEMMMQDFQTPEYLYGPSDTWPLLETKITELLDPEKRDEISSRLIESKDRMRPTNEAMWNDIFTLLPKGD